MPCGQFVLASLPPDGVDGGGCKSIGHILDETFVMVRHGTCSAADKVRVRVRVSVRVWVRIWVRLKVEGLERWLGRV